MRLLFVCDSLIGRGAEKLLNDLLPLLKENHTCELLILTDKNAKYMDNLKSYNIPIYVLPQSLNSHYRKIQYIKKIIVNGNYDIVHANLFPVIYYCSIVKKMLGKKSPKIVMTEHNTDNKRRHIRALRMLEKWIYKSYDKIISINQGTQSALVEWLQVEKENRKFCVVNNGVRIQEFIEAKEYPKSVIFEEIEKNDILLGMVGAFTRQKNHKMAIEIMRKLPKRYKLVFVGEGELEPQIKQMVSDMGLSERVKFLGFRSDISRLMKTVDVIIIPSEWEGFGLIAVEGMATGRPIVASDVKGLSEVVDIGGIKASTVEEFVNAVLYLENKEIYQKYQKQACVQAKKFDIINMKEKYEAVYRNLIGDFNE